MARSYGFRVYVVSAFPNRRSGNEAVDVSAESDARATIVRLLGELHVRGTQFLRPSRPAAPDEPARAIASVTVEDPAEISHEFVHLTVSMGETGSHPRATKAGKAPKKLENWSPEADHFVTLLFPSTAGDQMLVVVETIGRKDPIRRLIRLITSAGLDAKQFEKSKEEQARRVAKETGASMPTRKIHNRLVFEVRQAADNEYLDEIISSADSAFATFKSFEPSSRGRGRNETIRTLSIKLTDRRGREVGRSVGRSWTRKKRAGHPPSKAEGVSELGALLMEEDLLGPNEADQYDEASIAVRNKGGDSTRIAVDTLRDFFTYPVSDGRPGVRYYYDKVAPRLEVIAQQEQIDVAIISPVEVEEWLAD